MATPEQLADAARKRSEAIESSAQAELDQVWHRVPEDIKRAFVYIREEIPRREDPNDVKFLRDTRRIHMAPFRKFLKKEVNPHGE